MDRILETHYAPPNRISALQKEKTDLLRKSKDMQESRSVKTPESKHGKTLEKNRVDSEGRGKGGERGRERHSLGRS